MHLSPKLAYAALRSKAVVLLLLIHAFIVSPIVCGGSVFGPSFVVLVLQSS